MRAVQLEVLAEPLGQDGGLVDPVGLVIVDRRNRENREGASGADPPSSAGAIVTVRSPATLPCASTTASAAAPASTVPEAPSAR